MVYKFIGDLHFYASADAEENEIILSTVLSALTETVSMLLTCAPAARRLPPPKRRQRGRARPH